MKKIISRIKLLVYFTKENPILVFLIGFVSGIHFFSINLSVLVILTIFFSFSTKFLPNLSKISFVLIIGLVVGAFRMTLQHNYEQKYIEPKFTENVDTVGYIYSQPKIDGDREKFVFYAPELGKVMVNRPVFPTLEYGENLRLTGVLEKPENFAEFAYGDYLLSQGVYFLLRNPEVEVIDPPNNCFVCGFAAIVGRGKSSMQKRINSLLPEPESSLLTGFIIGGEGRLSEDQVENMRLTGTSHITSVSGYNVSLIGTLLMSISGIIDRKLLRILLIGFLIYFSFLVGLNNSAALRATIMGSLVVFAQMSGRKYSIINALLIVLAIFILANPYTIYSLSLQLSFLATFGLIFSADYFQSILLNIPIVRRLEDFASTICAIIWTTPVIVKNFGFFSLISPIVNLFVLPLVAPATVVGISMLTISYLSSTLAKILSYVMWTIIYPIILVINYFAQMQKFQFTNLSISNSQVVWFYLILIAVILEWKFKKLNAKINTY